MGDDGVVVDLERPAIVDRVAAAVAAGARLSITYWTPARDEATQRQVTPRMVFADGGHWYMVADDHRSGSERVFRLDRILDTSDTGIVDPIRAVTTPDPQRWLSDDPDIERVTLRLPAELTWMVERYPVDSMITDPITHAGASCTVVMPVTSEEWLRRLLLRVGPRAVVVAPSRWATLAADTASEVLERYGVVSPAT